MFHAKQSGRKGHHFFDQEMEARTAELLAVETSLRRALAQGELLLEYQPRIDLRTGVADSVEARLFWEHPELGLLCRDFFAQVAEESGLSQDLDAWSLRAVCRQIRDWERAGSPITVAVKLSPLCLLQGDLGGLVWNALSEAGANPRRLEIEFGEGSVARDNDTVALTLERLRDLGVRVALGSFGKGVSNLSCLKRVTVDRLKISPLFIGDLAPGTQDEEIVRAMIALGHGLGLQVLAEGVETRGQLEVLHALGCDQVQGDHCARAMPAEELTDWLRAQAPEAGRGRLIQAVAASS
jgi:EAL domain-containing protein (putative c-di-GMP-specific phosphodiesterase class I)